jgi:hypothetical protein
MERVEVRRYKTSFAALTYLQVLYERDNMITEKRIEIAADVKSKQQSQTFTQSNLVLKKKFKQINSSDGASFFSR